MPAWRVTPKTEDVYRTGSVFTYLEHTVPLVHVPRADGVYSSSILQRSSPVPLACLKSSDVGRSVAITEYALAVRLIFLELPVKRVLIYTPYVFKKMCAWWDEGKKKARIREFLHTFWGRDYFCFLFFFNLAYSRWTSSLPSSCLWSQRIFPSLPGSRLTIFYRDASSALLQLVNQWLNFTYSHSHAFRFERKNTNPTLVRIKLTTSALAGVQVTY